MNSWSFIAVFVTICAFASAGHYHHDGHGDGGDGGVAVHYSVVTEHKGGHGGGHVGGHASVHTWGHEDDGGHGGDDGGHYGGHDGGHYGGHYGGHDGGHYGGHDDGHYGGHDDGHDHYAHPKYEFSYGVKDPKTGDIKSQKESRDGGNVKGSYTVKEADGTTRHVEYSADKHKGFNAVVHTLGHAHGGHDAKHGYSGGHDDGHHGHGKASSFILVKKQEEKKH